MEKNALFHAQQAYAQVVLDGVVGAELGRGEDCGARGGDDPALVQAGEAAWGREGRVEGRVRVRREEGG